LSHMSIDACVTCGQSASYITGTTGTSTTSTIDLVLEYGPGRVGGTFPIPAIELESRR
jgi:hypothetical protein